MEIYHLDKLELVGHNAGFITSSLTEILSLDLERIPFSCERDSIWVIDMFSVDEERRTRVPRS